MSDLALQKDFFYYFLHFVFKKEREQLLSSYSLSVLLCLYYKAARSSFTLAEIARPSARPANFFEATPITLPIS